MTLFIYVPPRGFIRLNLLTKREKKNPREKKVSKSYHGVDSRGKSVPDDTLFALRFLWPSWRRSVFLQARARADNTCSRKTVNRRRRRTFNVLPCRSPRESADRRSTWYYTRIRPHRSHAPIARNVRRVEKYSTWLRDSLYVRYNYLLIRYREMNPGLLLTEIRYWPRSFL